MADEKIAPSSAKSEKAVGGKAHPQNLRVPDGVIIKRPSAAAEGLTITDSPVVQGDKAMQIIELPQGKPVLCICLIDGVGLRAEDDGRCIFVQGTVAADFFNVEQAKSKFAIKKDGTIIFNARGFDEVPAGADFDMLDIVALIEHNNSSKGKSADKAIATKTAQAEKKRLADDKKAADKKAKADKKAADKAAADQKVAEKKAAAAANK